MTNVMTNVLTSNSLSFLLKSLNKVLLNLFILYASNTTVNFFLMLIVSISFINIQSNVTLLYRSSSLGI